MVHIRSAEHAGGYRVWIEFRNGNFGLADLEPDLRGPVLEPLRNPEEFERFDVSGVLRTLTWEHGADLAPEYLHERTLVSRSID